MALDLEDKKYIHDTMAHYMGALKEAFEEQVKMLAELITDRPTRSEVGEMIDVRIAPLETRLIRIEAHLSI